MKSQECYSPLSKKKPSWSLGDKCGAEYVGILQLAQAWSNLASTGLCLETGSTRENIFRIVGLILPTPARPNCVVHNMLNQNLI